MKLSLCFLILAAFTLSVSEVSGQRNVIRDIKTFGAKGDGKTNDHQAFQKAAAYFNNRGGNGKLIISNGIYIIGRQTFTGGKPSKPAYEGENVLHFKHIKNFKLTGTGNAILKYRDSLKFGTFDPATGKSFIPEKMPFYDDKFAAVIGRCIYFESCNNISVNNLTLDGNNKAIITGGNFGDVGRQLPHYGIFIENSYHIVVDKINAHHFALDGICVSNKISPQKDDIIISNSLFQYNARQGLSWIGGNELLAKNCRFNNTGKGAFSSPPSAGVDIEAEVGPIRNGHFINCEFNNNTGVGMLADSGDDGDCTFTNCTFWGATNWSIWVTKPGFTFNRCKIYGSPVHGFNSPDEKNATKFVSCTFEDKTYQGKDPFGNYLIESNNAKRVSFTGCKFIANKKRLYWISIDPKVKTEEKYQFTNCAFVINNAADSNLVMMGYLRGMVLKNCTFEIKNLKAKNKGLSYILYREAGNVDLGGNRIIESAKK